VVAFVAARLAGLTFSVQARASEIRRTSARAMLPDRLRFAEFIVTNSRYNERFLHETLGRSAPPVHVVYNGLDLPQFTVPQREGRSPGPCRLLAVGRLIEPKGFQYLLEACAKLRDRGLPF